MTLLKFLPLFYSAFSITDTLQITTLSKSNLIIFQGKYNFFILNFQTFQQAIYHSNSQLWSLFKIKLNSLLYTLNYTFKKIIIAKGVGFKFFLKKTKQSQYLRIKAGYNQPLTVKFKNSIFLVKIPKATRLCFRSIDQHKLHLLTKYIKTYRIPNVYTGKGFRSRLDKRIRKEVHKSK